MTEPGWYHADGDPEGTTRYWDGRAWVGEPTRPDARNDVIYYAPAGEAEIDLGDVATRVSLVSKGTSPSYTTSPYSVAKASTNVVKRPPISEGLKNLTTLTCVFRAIPLGLVLTSMGSVIADSVIGDRPISSYAPPGISSNSELVTIVGALLVVVLIGGFICFVEVRAALKDRAAALASASFIALLYDFLTLANQLASSQRGTGTVSLSVITFGLQIAVTLWAVAQSRKTL